MSHLIFSEGKGFLATDQQWISDPEDASTMDMGEAHQLVVELNKTNTLLEAKAVPANNWSLISATDLCFRIAETVFDNYDTDTLTDFLNEHMPCACEYHEDGFWIRKSQFKDRKSYQKVNADSLEHSLAGELNLLEGDSISEIYHEIQDNRVIYAGDSIYWHQTVL